MFSKFTGAIVRAFLVIALLAVPSALLFNVTADAKQMVALVALFAGFLTFSEYNGIYPSLIEFRDAPPFNRMRYLMLFITVFCLAMVERQHVVESAAGDIINSVGMLIGRSMDFPFSPVQLAIRIIGSDATESQIEAVRTAAGLAYLISLVSLAVFVVLLKAGSWPRRDLAFNVWINLPTFDPTAGPDVIRRLNRDARINVALGFLLPFLIPVVVKFASAGFAPMVLTSPQTLIWTITAWAFLPASLFMRGIALGRISEMIRASRAVHGLSESSRRFASA